MKTLWYGFLAGVVIGCAGALPHANAASVEYPVSVCFALREGASLAAIETALEAQGFTPQQAGIVTGVAVRDECPDMRDSVLRQVP